MPDNGSRGPRFDPTINLGHLITLGTVVATLLGTAWVGDYRLSSVEKEVAKLSTIIVEEAKLTERLSDLVRRVDRIETLQGR